MYLFHFELSQELEEPLESPLLSVHPDEVDLPELEVRGLLESKRYKTSGNTALSLIWKS